MCIFLGGVWVKCSVLQKSFVSLLVRLFFFTKEMCGALPQSDKTHIFFYLTRSSHITFCPKKNSEKICFLQRTHASSRVPPKHLENAEMSHKAEFHRNVFFFSPLNLLKKFGTVCIQKK